MKDWEEKELTNIDVIFLCAVAAVVYVGVSLWVI